MNGIDPDRTIRVWLTCPHPAALDIAERLESAFLDNGNPVSLFENEDSDTWTVDVLLFGLKEEAAVSAVEAIVRPSGFDGSILAQALDDTDWVAKSLEGLTPILAGRFCVHGRHARESVPSGALALEIEAGQAFGTGHHGTTAGCLEAISDLSKWASPRTALDVGTGTGVLAIAIARLFRIRVLATDIDPIAVRIAGKNARINASAPLISGISAAGLSHKAIRASGPFDLITANILANPLIGLAHALAGALNSDGTVILSGLLTAQERPVLAAYRARNLALHRRYRREGWSTLVLRHLAGT